MADGDLKDHPVSPPCYGQRHLPAVAQGWTQTPPEMGQPQLPWAACARAWVKNFRTFVTDI